MTIPFLFGAACAMPSPGDDSTGDDAIGDDGGGGGGGGDDGGGGGGGDDEPPPPTPQLGDRYDLTSDLDVAASNVVPANVYAAIQALRAFEDSPGTAMLDLAEAAGVPAVDEIRDALPSYLEDRLIGWIDGHLEGTALYTVVVDAVAIVDEPFGQVELASTLDLGTGEHALDTIAVEVAGYRVAASVEAVPGELGTTAIAPITTSDLDLSIGEHAFSLKVGTLAWAAIERAIQARFGTDLTTALAAAIDCPELAHYIATKCVWGVCVGHETELNEMCVGAVGYAVNKLREQVTGVDFDAVILHAGQATGTDANGDLVAETLAGTWTAELDVGMGPRPVPATFTGTAAP